MSFTQFKCLIFLVGLGSSCFCVGESKSKWISLSPQVTELFFQLGLQENLGATTSGSHYPEAAKELKIIGQWLQPNLETILFNHPIGVVWDENSFQSPLEKQFHQLGIETLLIPLNSVQGLFDSSRILLKKFQQPENHLTLLRAEKSLKENALASQTFTFLALAWMDPPILFGKNTFFYDLITRVGGEGVLPSGWNSPFLKVSEEWLMAQSPQRVVFLSHNKRSTQLLKEKCLKWWPTKKDLCQSLPAEKFARASFTPIVHISELAKIRDRRDE